MPTNWRRRIREDPPTWEEVDSAEGRLLAVIEEVSRLEKRLEDEQEKNAGWRRIVARLESSGSEVEELRTRVAWLEHEKARGWARSETQTRSDLNRYRRERGKLLRALGRSDRAVDEALDGRTLHAARRPLLALLGRSPDTQ